MRTRHVVALIAPLPGIVILLLALGAYSVVPPAQSARASSEVGSAPAPLNVSAVAAVTLTGSGFQPAVLTVTTPATVTWHNATPHTAILHSGAPTASLLYLPLIEKNATGFSAARPPNPPASPGAPQAGRIAPLLPRTSDFFSVTLPPGGSFAYVFNSPGIVPYYALASQTFLGVVTVQPGIPPDPADIAPPLDTSVATGMYSDTLFLYTGPNPIQTGVAPGTIDPQRVVVMRGRVLDRGGQPLPGATISILNHPAYGQTLSRADGMFDLAANGGGLFTIQYSAAGFLPVQRQLSTPWRQFGRLPDVVLIPADPLVTVVDLSSNAMQVAQASIITDSAGTRRQTLLFPVGATAWMTLPGGMTQTLTTLHVRSTEYTVGPTGPQAMPGQLPPSSGYTYASEFSADEVGNAGARGPAFSQPLIAYNENFLSFTVGLSVPAGYYDAARSAWIPMPNGRVLKILSDTNGMANLDLTGSGIPAGAPALAALGITDAERGTLANLYPVGSSLWRFTTTHFSSFDWNMGITCKDNSCVPPTEPPPQLPPPFCPASQTGSIIECQSQALGENVDLVGTDFSLIYRSDLMPGRTAEYGLNIPLVGSSVPTQLLRIDLQVNVAGRSFNSSYLTASNQTASFQWDGKDAYGRQMQGSQPVEVRLGYVYPLIYGPCTFLGGTCSGTVGINLARMEFTLYQVWNTSIGAWNAVPEGLGGWSLDVHHSYDPFSKVLFLGTGERRDTAALDIDAISTVAGVGNTSYLGDGGPANQAGVKQPAAVAAGPDGTYFIAEGGNNRIRRVDTSGIITTMVGTGIGGFSGDGGLATQAQVFAPQGLSLGPDGSLYIADTFNNRIRRVGPDGIITTVAGNGTFGFSGDAGPATQARLAQPDGVKVAPDGTLYIADTGNGRIRRVSPDGLISTAAGTGVGGLGGDGGPATLARLGNPTDVAVAPDGAVYIADYGNQRVRRVDVTGIITTVAGGGICGSAFCGDGGPAIQAALSRVWGINFGPDGALYIADHDNGRIRRLGTDGIISTVAGGGTSITGYGGDGGPAASATLFSSEGVAVSPDGKILIADTGNWRIRLVQPVLPQFSVGNVFIPSDDGSEVYVFDASGRHLRTLDALTSATIYQFGYNAARQLASVTDGAGNVTTIQRDGSGHPTGITGPYGQHTTLTVDANGFLSSIANPASETTQFASSADGMLTTLTDPRGNIHHFTYDALGRLTSDQDPAGGFSALARTGASRSYSVTFDTPLSRTTTYETDFIPGGGQRQLTTRPNALTTTGIYGSNGTLSVLYPDGTKSLEISAPDPRWGMASPLPGAFTVTTTGGLTRVVSLARNLSLSDPTDLFSLTGLTDSLRVNGRLFTTMYDAASHALTATTPAGRQAFITLDALGRVIQEQVQGELPISYAYDGKGRLVSVSQGSGPDSRQYGMGYDAAGQLAVITDTLGRTTQFARDAAGRVLTQTQPDGQMLGYAYDANGNLSSLVPPNRPAHQFGYSVLDQQSVYTAPIVSGVSNPTAYLYNLDRQLTQVSLPDGQSVILSYDGAGRRSSESLARGTYNYAYNPASGDLAAVSAPGGISLSYGYAGPLLTTKTWTGAVAGAVNYAYDNDYRVASSRINGSYTTTFTYDADGLLNTAGAITLTHDAQTGQLTGATLGGTAEALSYDGFGELISDGVAFNGTPLFEQIYGFDRQGRVSMVTETNTGLTSVYSYSFDLDGRLTTVLLNGSPYASYTYDANGNRLASTRSTSTPAVITATYDAQDRLLLSGGAVYSYTANGDLLAVTRGVQTTNYRYDPLGNLVTVTLPSSDVLEYLIDGQNRRVGKLLNGTLVQGFLYANALNPIAELDSGQNIVSTFVYGSRPNVPDYMLKGGVTYRIIADLQGSPRLVVNSATGQVAQRMDFDEFGRVLTDTNPGFQPFGYAGGLYDRDTGLVRFGARDYDAQAGRWTAKDPLLFGAGQSNLYAYVNNDPINLFDSNGGDWASTASAALNQGWHYVKDHASQWAESAAKKLAKSPCYGPACLSTDKPEVTVGGSADLNAGGKTIVAVEVECSAGITTKGTAADPLFSLGIKVGAKVPSLTKIPGIGKYFGTSKEWQTTVGQAPDITTSEVNKADEAEANGAGR